MLSGLILVMIIIFYQALILLSLLSSALSYQLPSFCSIKSKCSNRLGSIPGLVLWVGGLEVDGDDDDDDEGGDEGGDEGDVLLFWSVGLS